MGEEALLPLSISLSSKLTLMGSLTHLAVRLPRLITLVSGILVLYTQNPDSKWFLSSLESMQ